MLKVAKLFLYTLVVLVFICFVGYFFFLMLKETKLFLGMLVVLVLVSLVGHFF